MISEQVAELQSSAQKLFAGLGLAADQQASWEKTVELGWLMLGPSETAGGLGLGLTAANAVHTEMGKALAAAEFLPALLAIDAVEHCELPNREALLASLMSGELRVTASLSESFVAAQSQSDGKLSLSGTAVGVVSADRASHALLLTEDHEHLVLLDFQQPGVQILEQAGWDVTRRLSDVELNSVVVGESAILASGEQAKVLCTNFLIMRDLALAADSVGGATALLKKTVEYLGVRQQFGRPLAMFQALKHRCADLQANVLAADALLMNNLLKIEQLGTEPVAAAEADKLARSAKQLACSVYMTVAEEALQLHGGIAMTAEHDCHLFLKRAMLNVHLGRSSASYDIELADKLLADLG